MGGHINIAFGLSLLFYASNLCLLFRYIRHLIKVRMAEKYRAAGILIYGDPHEYAPVASEKFPNGRWLSDDGVQRGSIIGGKGVSEGDPMSGGYPAKRKYARITKLQRHNGI